MMKLSNKNKLIVMSIIIGIVYSITKDIFPNSILTVFRLLFIVVTVMYIYMILKISYKTKWMKVYVIFLIALIVVISTIAAKIYVVDDLILDESYKVKDNLYYDIDNLKEARMNSLDVINHPNIIKGVGYSDFDYKVYTVIKNKLYDEDYFPILYDKIAKDDYIYYIIKGSSPNHLIPFYISKVNSDGEVIKISKIDVENGKNVLFIEGETDELYYYSTSCIETGIYFDSCYDYEVGTIEEDGKINKEFDIKDHRIQQAYIQNDELYFLGSSGYEIKDEETGDYIDGTKEYLYKYTSNGELVLKEELNNADKLGVYGAYDMSINKGGIFILYSSLCYEYRGCEEGLARLEEYNLDFDIIETSVFKFQVIDGADGTNPIISNRSLVENGDYEMYSIHGNDFKVQKIKNGYEIETHDISFKLEKSDNDLYIKYDTKDIVSIVNDSAFEYESIVENITFLITSVILYLLIIVDFIINIIRKRRDQVL